MKKNKKPGKYLAFYMECSRRRKMKYTGLCHAFKDHMEMDYPEFELIKPTDEERARLWPEFNPTWWGSGTEWQELHKFTPLRQTLVLLMAALNNEL